MNKRLLLITFFIFMLTICVPAVSAQTELLAPDMTQSAVDLLAIVCQNVNDYLTALNTGGSADYENSYLSYQKALTNLESMLGEAGKSYTDRLYAVTPYFTANVNELMMVQSECIAVRRDLQIALRSQLSGFEARPVYTFEDCLLSGYFANDGVCFLNGNIAYDADGYMTGRYNTDCFDANNFYPGSCWYCIYGNNEEGCISKPW